MASIADMFVSIGADISDFQRSMNKMNREFSTMSKELNNVSKGVSSGLTGITDETAIMAKKMRDAFTAEKESMKKFQIEQKAIQYQFFELGQSMDSYAGKTNELMAEINKLGQQQKKVTDNMMKNNNLMKTSFIQSIGTIMARSTQSEKIAQNFERMGNPLYAVNNGLLKVGQNLENLAKQGNASVLALKMLGPTANMKELNDMTRMINTGLMRTQALALGVGLAFVGMNVGIAKMAEANGLTKLSDSLANLGETLNNAFLPFVKSWDIVMGAIVSGVDIIMGLWESFSKLNPELSAAIQWFAYLTVGLTALLSPLAIGIGLTGGLTASFSALWLVISPFVTGLLTVVGTAAVVAAALVALGGAIYLLWTKTDWFKGAVLSVWDQIKSGWNTALDFIGKITDKVMNEVWKFIQEILGKIQKFWDENGQAIMKIVNVIMLAIGSVIKQQMNMIKGIFEVVLPIISSSVKVTWEAIKMVIKSALDIILGLVSFWSKALTGDWKGAFESIKQIGTNIMNNIVTMFRNIDLYSIGRDIINGLIKGLNSMFGSLISKAQDIANSIKNKIAGALQIHSPSRVMIGFGENVGQGLAIGMDKTMSLIKSTSNTMANNTIPEFESSENNTAQYTTPINITLNYSGNGNREDALSMVDIIDKQLAKRWSNGARIKGLKGATI